MAKDLKDPEYVAVEQLTSSKTVIHVWFGTWDDGVEAVGAYWSLWRTALPKIGNEEQIFRLDWLVVKSGESSSHHVVLNADHDKLKTDSDSNMSE